VLAQVVDNRLHAGNVAGVTVVIALIVFTHTPVRGAIDVVGVRGQRRQPAGDEDLAQRVRRR
jgi:hypothetical protein